MDLLKYKIIDLNDFVSNKIEGLKILFPEYEFLFRYNDQTKVYFISYKYNMTLLNETYNRSSHTALMNIFNMIRFEFERFIKLSNIEYTIKRKLIFEHRIHKTKII